MKNKLLIHSTKKFIIFFACFIFALYSIKATSFQIEGKEIYLIDFPGYKHEGMEIAEDIRCLSGLDVYDVLIPTDALTPGMTDNEDAYNDFFVVAIQPAMLFGIDYSLDDFQSFREEIKSLYIDGSLDYTADSLNEEYRGISIFTVKEISSPRIFVNESDRIGISSVVKFDGSDTNVVNFQMIMLIKGKIIWVAYYDNYSSIMAYENAVSKCLKFAEILARANIEPFVEESSYLDDYQKLVEFDFNNGTKQVSSIGYPKAYGLEYSFEIPVNWKEKVSLKEHIVHSFNKEYGDKNISLKIIVDDSISSLYTDLGIDFTVHDYIEDPIDLLPSGATLINSGFTTIDYNKEAFFYEYSLKQTVLDGVVIEMYVYSIITIYDSSLVNIGFYFSGVTSDNFDSNAETFKPLFFKILNSFHFIGSDKSVSSTTAKELGKELSKTVNSLIWLLLFLPILIWGLLGIILRYGVMHHSMKKDIAAVVTLGVGLLAVAIMFGIFGDIGALGSAIGALFFYFIVRIGHSEYDEEMKHLKSEKEKATRIYADSVSKTEQADQILQHANKMKEEAARSLHISEIAWREAAQVQEKAKKTASEIKRLEQELSRVQERNSRLEEEAKKQSINSATKTQIVKDRYYYQSVLDLPNTFTEEELKHHFKKKTVLYHPDKVNSLGPKLRIIAEDEMKEIRGNFKMRFELSILNKYAGSTWSVPASLEH